MPIPAFTIDGVLPPYVGPRGPGGLMQDMTPYVVSAVEVCTTFGTTDHRRAILRNWIQHRADLRSLNFGPGFQWLDGSFVEDKVPRDLDVVTFIRRPPLIQTGAELLQLMTANPNQFSRAPVKARYSLDAFFVDLDGTGETIVNTTRYLNGLFSHRRGDGLWKGMLQVRLDDVADDIAALAQLNAFAPALAAGAVIP